MVRRSDALIKPASRGQELRRVLRPVRSTGTLPGASSTAGIEAQLTPWRPIVRKGARVRVWRRPPDHNRVEPGDALGVVIYIPAEHVDSSIGLLSPWISGDALRAETSEVALYATVGRDTLNGRVVRHRWVNVLGTPPGPGDGWAVGALGFVGSRSAPISRMWIRAGQPHVPGRVTRFRVDREHHRLDVGIRTAGGTLTTTARFEPQGQPWTGLPTRYHIITAEPPILYHGDEWGTRHDGSGTVTWRPVRGEPRTIVNTYVGLDVDLGWDYTFVPVTNKGSTRAG